MVIIKRWLLNLYVRWKRMSSSVITYRLFLAFCLGKIRLYRQYAVVEGVADCAKFFLDLMAFGAFQVTL